MKPFVHRSSALAFTSLMLAVAALAPAGSAWSQSFCASDGQPRPVQLLERFINADCESCWADPATPKAGANTLAIDWVLPGSKGDDAPLSAVAARESLDRLAALRQTPPAQSFAGTLPVTGLKGATLRVAHGLPLSGYLGTSIELKPIPAAAKGRQWTAWLALVETLPAGTENSPVERNLIRNALQTIWDGGKPLSKTEQKRFFDQRSMSIAEGVNPERVRVVGWVEDEKGQVRLAAQSRCVPQK
jgi:hypothetical protein